MKCIDLINSSELADVLNQEEKEIISKNSTIITYGKGDCLVKKGEYVNNTIFICSGFVKIHLEFKRRSIIMNVLGSQRFVLLSQMISDDVQPFDITALEETTVFLTDVNIFRQILEHNSKLSSYLLKHLNRTIMDYIYHNLSSLTQNNIHGRLANIILYLSEVVFKSTSFDMLLSRKELSELCNISRENVIKVLYEFDNDGIIKLSGKSINILSVENLRRIANHG